MATRCWFHLFVLFLGILPIVGCGSLYLPGGWDGNPPQTTPLRMSDRAEYIGGDINVSSGYNGGESNIQGKVFYSTGTGGSWWRLSGSGFLYAGSYEVRYAYDSSLRGQRLYGGPGGVADLNVSVPLGDVSVGVGATAGLLAELGPYRQIWTDRAIGLVPLVGGYLFFNTKLQNSDQIGFQVYAGFPGFFNANLQYDLGDFLLSTGAGVTFALGDHAREAGRFMLSAAYRVPR